MYTITVVHCLPWLPSINICRVEVKHFIIPSLSSPSPVLFLTTKMHSIKMNHMYLLVYAWTLHLVDSAMQDFGQMMVSWEELFLFHHHAHESMDKHWSHEIYSHTDLPTLGIYLTAHHSIPWKEDLHCFKNQSNFNMRLPAPSCWLLVVDLALHLLPLFSSVHYVGPKVSV